ncbi:MAG TPA: glycosyltransferase [Pyrinomonadaceae bacterium]|nr:glycosyltransferase [Pyrinomonadaceae bacterium]
MKVSIIIPTHNRLEKLRETVEYLRLQDFPTTDYEIVVVDDGSNPPVTFEKEFTVLPNVRIVRLEGEERSVARNSGAREANGELLIFVDDDITTKEDFVENHWQIHQEFTNALAIGEILLPESSLDTPFGRFRQKLEQTNIPRQRGLVAEKNFCAAANASIKHELFLQLGGFDTTISSSEDQDFALRHTAQGGKIVFLPEAEVIHRDNALDIRGYCQRNEWGSRLMKPFYQRYPDLPQNIERERINGLAKWGREPFLNSLRKTLKSLISSKVSVNILFKIVAILEKTSPNSSILDKFYRLLLGAHIFRGYRKALRKSN